MTDPFSEPTLEQLAAKAQEGDHDSFRRLVERTQSRAFALAFRFLADEDDARDAAQESFIRVWENLHRYDPAQKFQTWFYRVVMNIALDRLRTRKRWWNMYQRRENLTVDIPDMSDHSKELSNAELADIIKALTEELPLKQRTVLVLRDFQDLSTEEAAQVAGMSVESVKTNLHYARTRIRELLEERYGVTREAP